MRLPKVIQGGMGVAVSSWQLANAVSRRGELGVISGTGIALVLIGRLGLGDPGGHIRRALAHFPLPDLAARILDLYFVEGGLQPDQAFQRPQMWTIKPSARLLDVTLAANFVEVWLAKEGHNNPVGINLLEKVQLPNLPSLYGAMLAGVDVVIMGAGIPMQIPGALDRFVNHEAASYRLDVTGAGDEPLAYSFDPQASYPGLAELVGPLKRPEFYPIVSSVVLAQALLKRANGPIQGFVIEMPTAGGHNAPPRGDYAKNERGEPIYGEKDAVDLSRFRKMELPFWLAGGYGSPEKLREAIQEGAAGIQVGTAFAFCDQSGFDPALRQQVVDQVLAGKAEVLTSSTVSPTGFPFKVVGVPGTASSSDVYQERGRVCDIGYLRHIYQDETGKVGYRCPAEPVDAYVRKGGEIEDTEGRVCLCNQLGSAAGMAQLRGGEYREPSIVTSGDDLPQIVRFIPKGKTHYSADDVLDSLLSII